MRGAVALICIAFRIAGAQPRMAGLVWIPAVVCGRSMATPDDGRIGRRILGRLSACVQHRRPDACGRHHAGRRHPVAMVTHAIDRDPGSACLLARPTRSVDQLEASHAEAASKSSLLQPLRIRRAAGGMESRSVGSPRGASNKVYSDSRLRNLALLREIA